MGSRRGQRKKNPKTPKKRRRERTSKPKVKAVKAEELRGVVDRAREIGLPPEDCENLEAAIETLAFLVGELDRKTLTLARLRSLFGLKKSENSRNVLGELADRAGKAGQEEASGPDESSDSDAPSATAISSAEGDEELERPKGHGRNGVSDYPGAETIEVPHESLKPSDPCPACDKGKVYEQKHRPRVLLRVTGQPPLKATVIKLQTFRCNPCGKVFRARPPDGLGERKYDATSAAMIALLKYGGGVPFNRLKDLQRNMGIPLPASTQWEVVRDAAAEITEVHEALIWQAAQGEVLHNDDTSAKILELIKENKALRESGEAAAGERMGIFATGIVSVVDERRMALFFTGRNHAGENAEDLLRHRAAELGPPIQMCDALDRNVPLQAETLLGNCLAHGRRRFVEGIVNFPDECEHVLNELAEVYKHDKIAKERKLTAAQRLEYHQANSASVMEDLYEWLERQLDDRLIEPNSSLGDSIRYLLNHWEPLTLFLRVAGAPLDNNRANAARGISSIIVDRQATVLKEAAERLLVLPGVLDALGREARRTQRRREFVEVLVELLDEGL